MTQSEWELKKLLRQYDDVELPMDLKFYDRLHNKIMAQIEEIDLDSPKRIDRMRATLQEHWRNWFYPNNVR